MVILCWAAKGGSGTTVVAATLALSSARPVLLVDLDGELPAVMGMPAPRSPGVFEWLSSEAPAAHLADLTVEMTPHAALLPWCEHSSAGPRRGSRGSRDAPSRHDDRWALMAGWLAERMLAGVDVIIDAGTGTPQPALAAAADHRLLVTRRCYLSLMRAARAPTRPSGVIVVDEPGRALSSGQVERATGAPVIATVSFDPAIARAVDAGLLTSRVPRTITRQLRRVAA